MAAPEVSHGRGGAGNITPDDTQYADAEIVRTADEGTGVSTGRGGTLCEIIFALEDGRETEIGCRLSARLDPCSHLNVSNFGAKPILALGR